MSAKTIIDKQNNAIDIFIKMRKPKPSIVYDTYWRFAAERQSVFFNRIKGHSYPWTNDIIIKRFKFTNAYRATDRVSQYLIREVIYKGKQTPKEVLFRILLFKLFNKVETWEALSRAVGAIRYETYEYGNYNKILEEIKQKGEPIYSGAYIMASGRSAFGYPLKHQNHLRLLESIINGNLPEKIQDFNCMKELYRALIEYATIGSFLAYQFATDINYSNLTQFSEMEFVMPGPGAKDGIRKCFADLGDYSEEDIIKMMAEYQHHEFDRLEIQFQNLWGRPLQLIDCQNLFCEVDKYSRVAHPEVNSISNRIRIKQKFSPTSLKPIEYFLPPKWGVRIPAKFENQLFM